MGVETRRKETEKNTHKKVDPSLFVLLRYKVTKEIIVI